MSMSSAGKTFHPLQIVVRFVRAVSFQVPCLATLKTLSSIHSLLKLTKLLLKRQLKSAKRVILPLICNFSGKAISRQLRHITVLKSSAILEWLQSSNPNKQHGVHVGVVCQSYPFLDLIDLLFKMQKCK